ncbi:hypothetical protein RISK_000974 [Rhodopirellula islandica]|uniref:Uncharacterized protein n=1 Tax=Rhodopirellula islandica TaxID=595434 RepID=A0A0J1BL66_RHOIS|nr:hypothetical protein RISK_000974 [Rhodopirellula islandica]
MQRRSLESSAFFCQSKIRWNRSFNRGTRSKTHSENEIQIVKPIANKRIRSRELASRITIASRMEGT